MTNEVPKPTPLKKLTPPVKHVARKREEKVDFSNPVLTQDEASRIKKGLGL